MKKTSSRKKQGSTVTVLHTKKGAAPLFTSAVSAGFPSPADDHIEQSLNLHTYVVKNPAATFFVRVQGDSMTGAGIFSGDILVVDRSLEPKDGRIVIAVVDGELTVKRLKKKGTHVFLLAENEEYPSIAVTEEMDMVIWGVVTSSVREL